MSLKDLIDRTISEELNRLAAQQKRSEDTREPMRLRFARMLELLQEMVASVDAEYLDAIIGEFSATLILRRNSYGVLRKEEEWKIEPHEESGIVATRLKEVWVPEPEIFKNEYFFNDEMEAAGFLAIEIGKHVARWRHNREMRKRILKKK